MMTLHILQKQLAVQMKGRVLFALTYSRIFLTTKAAKRISSECMLDSLIIRCSCNSASQGFYS